MTMVVVVVVLVGDRVGADVDVGLAVGLEDVELVGLDVLGVLADVELVVLGVLADVELVVLDVLSDVELV
eukprot:3696974-Pyramimonas_sp.AAC.1